MVPILDIVHQFRGQANQNRAPNGSNSNNQLEANVTKDDFKNNILSDYLKLTKVVTPNSKEILYEKYRSLDGPDLVNVDNFLTDIFDVEGQMKQYSRKPIRLFKTEDDVEEYKDDPNIV